MRTCSRILKTYCVLRGTLNLAHSHSHTQVHLTDILEQKSPAVCFDSIRDSENATFTHSCWSVELNYVAQAVWAEKLRLLKRGDKVIHACIITDVTIQTTPVVCC